MKLSNKKLQLNKEVISELDSIKGGAQQTANCPSVLGCGIQNPPPVVHTNMVCCYTVGDTQCENPNYTKSNTDTSVTYMKWATGGSDCAAPGMTNSLA